MLNLPFLILVVFLPSSMYATSYYSSSKIIGYSPEFKDESTSYTYSSPSKGHIPEKHDVVDGYTRSFSDGFKFVEPSSAGHHRGSFQTFPQVGNSNRDNDVLLLPLDLSEFWTSQGISTPAQSSYLRSSTSGGFRQAEHVVYSSSSRTPTLQNAYSYTYSPSSHTAHDASNTQSPDEPSPPARDGDRVEVKSDGYPSKAPVFVSSKPVARAPKSSSGNSDFNHDLDVTREISSTQKTQEPTTYNLQEPTTSTHFDLNTDTNRKTLATQSEDQSDSLEVNQDVSTIRSNEDLDEEDQDEKDEDDEDQDEDGIIAYLVSEEGNPGTDFLLTKSALIQSGLVFKKVVRMSANTVDAGGKVEILDSNSFHLTSLRYAGPGPARWIAGNTFPIGLHADTVVLASWAPWREEEILTLPGHVTLADISWLALYCSTCPESRVVMEVYIPEAFL